MAVPIVGRGAKKRYGWSEPGDSESAKRLCCGVIRKARNACYAGQKILNEAHIADADLAKGPGEARRRGLSRQQLCIAVAIDERESPVAVVCGHGKPSTARIKDGLLPHIKQGSRIVHDKEKAHNGLVRAAKCTDEAYKADVRDPAYLECMAMANSLCSWLKRYLRRFVGMDPKNLQSYLNWFVCLFRVNQSKERWPKNGKGGSPSADVRCELSHVKRF